MRTIGLALLLMAAGCSGEQDRGGDGGIRFGSGNAADGQAPVAVTPLVVSTPEPLPQETGTPPAWAGTYAVSQALCAKQPWRFSGVGVLPPDGRSCAIGQISTPAAGKVNLLLSCSGPSGTSHEVWQMNTRGGDIAIDREVDGVSDHIALTKCSR